MLSGLWFWPQSTVQKRKKKNQKHFYTVVDKNDKIQLFNQWRVTKIIEKYNLKIKKKLKNKLRERERVREGMGDLYALDFDGVLCDSCGESSLSAVKVIFFLCFLNVFLLVC